MAAFGAALLAGCATKTFGREQAGVVDARLSATQGQASAQQGVLQAQGGRLTELGRTTREDVPVAPNSTRQERAQNRRVAVAALA
jgi:hypothetical protein